MTKLEEFIFEIEKPWETRTASLATLGEHFKNKDFTQEDVLNFYKQRDTPKFIEAVKFFEQGKLFAAQMQSYESWEKYDYVKEDRERAERYWSLEDAAMMRSAKGTPDMIRLFITLRIFGSRPRADDMSNKAKDKWIYENKKYNWYWNK